ncbi:MAG TPA: Ig-like domain-containing protein, partial [Mucilaginibacter sp.]
MKYLNFFAGACLLAAVSCSKDKAPAPPVNPPASFSFNALKVNGVYNGFNYININNKPVIKISFSAPLNRTSVTNAVALRSKDGTAVNYSTSYENGDSTVVVTPSAALQAITQYSLNVSTSLTSSNKGSLSSAVTVQLTTAIDSTDKFTRISDDALLDLVEQQTLKYFWDFGHPTSGLARERNTSGDVVTTGGSGFGIMAIVAGVNRNFISRADGLARMQKIASFLKNTAQKFHGAFPHWMNGATGAAVPFSTQDDGADLVETAYLMQG